MTLAGRILAGAQVDLGDLVAGVDPPAPPAPSVKDSDRYMTSPEILAIVTAQWLGIDLDPCWDPESDVKAKQVYDIRQGQDGLVLPWHGRVWCNPPYSMPEPWLARAAQHGAAGGEVLAIVPAATGTRGWSRFVWPFACICFLSPRPKFKRAGTDKWREASKDSAVLYYGPHRQAFAATWAPRGELVSSARLLPVPRDIAREP